MHGKRFAAQHAFIDIGIAFANRTVHGDLLPGPNGQEIADPDAADRNLRLRTVRSDDDRIFRLQTDQLFQRAVVSPFAFSSSVRPNRMKAMITAAASE